MENNKRNNRAFCVAPMLNWSDRHCRYFHRLISKKAHLYTEMVVDKTLIYGDFERYLKFNDVEHPLALQIGGSVPDELYKAVKIALPFNYDEINFNLGCPSDKVQHGKFGACLMKEPELVVDCIRAMVEAVNGKCEVSVKCRIGVDEQDVEGSLDKLVSKISDAGVRVFIVHARKAWLDGLSPKENREVPPLNHERIIRLKRDFPDNEIIINGGIRSIDEARWFLDNSEIDGIMLGREVYHNPYILSQVDKVFYGDETVVRSREEIINEMSKYAALMLGEGVRLNSMTRHMMGLYHASHGARAYRRYLGEMASQRGADEKKLIQALELVS